MEGKLSYLPLSSVHGSIGQYKTKKKTAVVIESEEEETKFQKKNEREWRESEAAHRFAFV